MPEVRIDVNMGGFETHFDMQEAVVKLQKQLRWLLRHLDSMNVQFISTNMTEVKSEDGTTHLDGSQLKMKDSDGNIRLVMGYNPETGNYEFTMRNKAGVETLLIDEDGDAIFTGTVAGSKIIGTEIEGGKITGAEIEGAQIKGGSITTDTTINVGTDATVGEKLHLKDGAGIGGTLSIYDGTTPTLLLRGEGSRDVRISTSGTIELVANAVTDQHGKKFINEGYVGMYVTVDGVDYPVKFT